MESEEDLSETMGDWRDHAGSEEKSSTREKNQPWECTHTVFEDFLEVQQLEGPVYREVCSIPCGKGHVYWRLWTATEPSSAAYEINFSKRNYRVLWRAW
jgi:hypothetical protein